MFGQPPAGNRTEPPARQISPELAVETFDHRIGITSEDADDEALQKARKGYAVLGERLKAWHRREAVIYSNKFELEAKKKMMVGQMVKSELDKGLDLPTAAQRELRREIDNIEKRIDAAFRNRIKSDEAREIRQHVKAMTKSERAKFLYTADSDVVASVLAAKPFLSGLGPAEAAMLRQQTTATWFPLETTRREKLKRAEEMFIAASQLYFGAATSMISKDLADFEEQQAAMKAAAAGTVH